METRLPISFEKRTLEYQLASVIQLTDLIDFEIDTRSVERIDTPEQYSEASESMNKFYDFGKAVEEYRKKAVAPLNEQKQKIQAAFNPLKEKIDGAVKDFKEKLADYQKREELKALEAAKEAAEAERLQQEALNESLKTAKTQEEAEQIVAAAEAEKMNAQLERSIQAPTVSKSVSVKKKWEAVVTDPVALIKFISEHPEFLSWLKIQEKQICKYAAMTDGHAAVPGVTFKASESVSVSRSRKTA